MQGWNHALFEALNLAPPAPLAAPLALALTRYATALLAALPLLLVWRLGRRGWVVAGQVWLCMALAGLAVYGLKAAWYVPRPYALGLGHLWLAPSGRSSFPSAHAASAMAAALPLAAWLWRQAPGRGRWAAGGVLALGALVGWSRVALGVHFPADVLASWALALGCALAAWGLCAGWRAGPGRALARGSGKVE